MQLYIGIDDTDNLETKGTGNRARRLAVKLAEEGFGAVTGVSRHQLFVSPDIPYTSHNSSLCIGLETEIKDIAELAGLSAAFLVQESAEGSDPGLCIAFHDIVSEEMIHFGKAAKVSVLTKSDAYGLAEKYRIHLSEHGGTGGGVIGALAGVALRADGNDGRFVWVKGIREMEGVFSAREIYERTEIRRIVTEDGDTPEPEDRIDVGEWFRPVLLCGVPTLLVEKDSGKKEHWKILEPKYIKAKY